MPLQTRLCLRSGSQPPAADKVKHILGGGGNLWTEVIPELRPGTIHDLSPRLRMAEATWSDAKNCGTSRDRFACTPAETRRDLRRLKMQQVNYRATETSGGIAMKATFCFCLSSLVGIMAAVVVAVCRLSGRTVQHRRNEEADERSAPTGELQRRLRGLPQADSRSAERRRARWAAICMPRSTAWNISVASPRSTPCWRRPSSCTRSNWRLLAAAADQYMNVPHSGFIVAGKFERGQTPRRRQCGQRGASATASAPCN